MDKIRVKILDSGTEAKEVGKEAPIEPTKGRYSPYYPEYRRMYLEWEKAEASLRTFTISQDFPLSQMTKAVAVDMDNNRLAYEPGTIHDAEELSDGRIKIIS